MEVATHKKVRAGYKATELGVVPEDWHVKKIADVCENITTGKLDANAMVLNGQYRFYTCAKDYYFINKYAFDTEALLISGNGANVGYIHHYKGKFNAYQRTYVLSGFSEDILYTKSYLDRNLKERIKVEVNAGGTPYIVRGTLADMLAVFPENKNEQKAIASALSDIDSYIESLSKLIEKRKNIKIATMQQLLTGKKRLPGFRGEWEKRFVSSFAEFTNGKPFEDKVVDSGKYKLITLDSVSIAGELKTNHKTVDVNDGSLKKDDLVMVLSDIAHARLLGLCGVIPCDNEYVLNQRMGRLRLSDEVNPVFIKLQINRHQEFFRMRGQGSSQRHIYKRDAYELEIELPPTKTEQIAIAEVLLNINQEMVNLEKLKNKFKSIKQGMMHELLTGNIRLV